MARDLAEMTEALKILRASDCFPAVVAFLDVLQRESVEDMLSATEPPVFYRRQGAVAAYRAILNKLNRLEQFEQKQNGQSSESEDPWIGTR